jgi:transposase
MTISSQDRDTRFRSRNLFGSEIRSIQARIGTETADELAACFSVHPSTIYKWTRGMNRARKWYAARVTKTDRELLGMASRLSQAEMARHFGVSRAAICIRLKRIREKGMGAHDKHVYQERSGSWGGGRKRRGHPQAMVQALKDENGSLKRELAIWQRRAERAEAECLKWKATADEWRLEFMKKARSKALGQRHD